MEGPEPGFVSRRAILFGPMKSHARRALRDIIQQSQDARRSSNNGETASVGSEAVIDLGAVRSSQRSGRSVAALRPRKALLIDAGISVSDAARKMAAANADAALVRTSSSSRAAVGIVTDTDVCRKVVALGRDADATAVEAVMTRNPQTVLWNATASSALCTMVDNCFRRAAPNARRPSHGTSCHSTRHACPLPVMTSATPLSPRPQAPTSPRRG